MSNVYRSKVDTWLLVLMVVLMACSMAVALAGAGFIASNRASSGWVVAVLTALVGAGLPFWILVSTSYELASGTLQVRCGPLRIRVPLSEITRITPSRSPLSSPALSLDRLRIEYGQGKSLMISPRDKEQFLLDLRAAKEAAS